MYIIMKKATSFAEMAYESPSFECVEAEVESVLCTSDGVLQDYEDRDLTGLW